MTFTLRIPLVDGIESPERVAFALELAARQLRLAGAFGANCADGFTTQNISSHDGLGGKRIIGTYAVKDS